METKRDVWTGGREDEGCLVRNVIRGRVKISVDHGSTWNSLYWLPETGMVEYPVVSRGRV